MIRSSIRPDPANRIGAVQTDAANVNVKRMYFMIHAPFEPVFEPDFVSKVAVFAIL